MWMIRKTTLVVILILNFIQSLSAKDENWPYCGPFSDEKGYPIGCKSSPYDLCANQSDECIELVCNGDLTKDAFRACIKACDQQPVPVSVTADEYTCWCSQVIEPTCYNTGPKFAQYVNLQPPSQPQTMITRRKGDSKSSFWGSTVQIPSQSLLPVFCESKSPCDQSYSLCITAGCPRSDMCRFEGKCYFITKYEQGFPESLCQPDAKPAAIEERGELMNLYQLLKFLPILNIDGVYIASSGFVEASSTDVIWRDWENIQFNNDLIQLDSINPESNNRVLCASYDEENFLFSWELKETDSSEIAIVLCEASAEDDEESDPTTTTTFTTPKSDPTTTTTFTTPEFDPTTTTTFTTPEFDPTTTTTFTTPKSDPTTTMPFTTESDPETTSTTPFDTTTTITTFFTTTTMRTTTTEREDDNITTTIEAENSTSPEPNTSTTDEATTTNLTTETTTTESGCEDCVKNDQYGKIWSCCSGVTCTDKCPLEAKGRAFWSCGDDKQFNTAWPDYAECTNTWINNLTTLIEEEKVTPFTLIMDLDQYIKDSSLFGHEIDTSLNFTMTSLEMLLKEQEEAEDPPVNKLNQRKFMSEMALGVIDKLLILTKPWEQLNQSEATDLGWKMNKLTETFGFSVTEKAKSIGDNYNMTGIKGHIQMESQFFKHRSGSHSEHIVKFPLQEISQKSSSIRILKLPKMFSDSDIHLEVVGQLIPKIFAEKLFPARINRMGDEKKRINSGMISMTLLGPDGKPIHEFHSDDAVLVTFKHSLQAKGPQYETIWHELYPGEKPTAIRGTERCAFWNASSGCCGEWDVRGCRIVNSSHWFTICECNHLSSFALLMDVHQYIAKDKIMEIISIVFSSLSVISLTLTLVVLHFLKGIQGERNSIGKHLCVCLLVGHLMALTVLDRSYFGLSQEVCVGVAISLHYIFLAAFVWMAVEGHHLYRLVVRVFDSGRDLSKIYLCLGYGIPVIIVGITVAVTVCLQDHGYANDELCWLSSPNYIWAFMGPVLFLTLINLAVLVLAMRVAVTAGTQQKKSFMSRVKVWIKGWFSLSSLLGVTWIFGFFYIQLDHNFAYAFVTLNGLQGVFIFLTRVVFNEQVKTAMKKGAKQRAMMKRFYNLAVSNIY
ncbi:Hypothetical predicted protein [Cloeon dipterum]|uniref:G-protein coupled receptors family 2 profile 2 domain-containing protein n=1 Tax=Cloeon dipterum TaxID=197152 RepID=A0A8S1BLE3_9INSE|nr:Hypothetical predicted protein [Cloeon dipterum]